ncbi:MAG: hypothetical protein KGV59_00005, partial [Tenacibaculum sp.]|nr:hypothetical protein [Tenacibaculum sp.]
MKLIKIILIFVLAFQVVNAQKQSNITISREVNTNSEIYDDNVLRVWRLALPVGYQYFTKYMNSDVNKVKEFWKATEKQLNELYMREVGVKFKIIDDERLIQKDKAVRDEIFGGWGITYSMGKSTEEINKMIGSESYDIGLFLEELDKIPKIAAGLAKGVGYGYYNKHKGDSFSVTQNIETIAHELGHLLGSAHTASQDALNSLKIEPKLGQSLMGYGASPKMFFSLMNIQDMRKKVLYPYYTDAERKYLGENTSPSLGERNNFPVGIVTENSAPRFNKEKLKKSYTIPKNTFFQFQLEATDKESSDLLYASHQIDKRKAKFKARPLSENSTITFQENYDSSGYVETPFDAKSGDIYNFLLAVNDGKNAYKENYAVRYDSYKTQVKVVEGTPFTVNALKPYYSKRGHINLRWNVDKNIFANTKVRILLSDDFGETFKYVLKESTENDGECEVILPDIEIGKIPYKNNIQKVRAGVIKIEVIDHVAYALTALKPTNSRYQFTGGFEVVEREFGITFKNTPNPNIEIYEGEVIPDVPKGIKAITKCSDGSANIKYSEERIDINDDKIKYIVNRIWTATNKCAEKVSFVQKIKVKNKKPIAKLPLTVMLKNISKVYDGNTTATLTANDFTISGVQGSDVVSLDLANITATYDNKNVGTNKTVTVTNLALKGADVSKYQLQSNSVNGTVGTITKKSVTVNLIGKVSKIYDGTTTAKLTKENYTFSSEQGTSSNSEEEEEEEISFNKEQWHKNLMKYIRENDRSKIKPYRNFYVEPDKITIGDGETVEIKLIDDNGNKVEKDVQWCVLVTMPFDKFFSAEESRENTPAKIIGGVPYQVASHLIINEEQSTITARKRVKKEVTVYAWVVAIYKNKYAHLIEVDIKSEEHQKRERQVEEKIQEILEKMKNLSDKDKVVYAFNYLVDNVTYDDLYYGDATYYNTFIKKGAVCEGYATGFQLLMERSGIVSEYQEGFVKKGVQGETTASRHAWNRVLIDGEWYYVDATWGDPRGRAKDYRYLFASREFFNQSRQMTDDGENLGKKLLGYGSGHTISIDNDYKGESVDEQISKKVKNLKKGKNKIIINIPWDKTDLQYEIGEKLNQYEGVKFIEYRPLQSSAELQATIFEYTVEYSGNSNVNTEEVTVNYSDLGGKELKITVTLNKPVELVSSNFFSEEASIVESSFKNENNTNYEFVFEASNHKDITFTIKKEGYSFNNGTKTYNLPDETFVEKPNVKFFGKGANYGILTGLIPNKTQYNLGKGVWVTAKNEIEKVYPVEKIYYHSPTTKAKIFVRNKELNNHSAMQEIYINRPFNVPEWVKVVNENGINIVKYARDTEYRLVNAEDNTWVETTGETIRGLEKGEYFFRTKGRENNFSSSNVKITINTTNTIDSTSKINGFIESDEVELSNLYIGTYDTKNVGANKMITVTGLSLRGGDAGNYNLKNTTISKEIGEITKKPVSVTLVGKVSKVYDGNNTATLTENNYQLNGVIGSDELILNNPTKGNYDNANVGVNKTIFVSDLTLKGTDANNYELQSTSVNGTIGEITAKPKTPLTITLKNISKVYDGNNTATLKSTDFTISGVQGSDVVSLDLVNITATYDTKNVGTNKTVTVNGLTLKGADASKYKLTTTSVNETVGTITKKLITATLTGKVTKVHDGNTTATVTAGNFNLTGKVGNDTVEVNFANATATYDNANVGTSKTITVNGLTLKGTDANNYELQSNSISGMIGEITKAKTTPIPTKTTLTATLKNISKVYDGNNTATLTANDFIVSGVQGSDVVSLDLVNITATYDTKNVGTNKTVTVNGLTLKGADASKYKLTTTSVNGTVGIITKKLVTVTPYNQSKEYGDTDPTLTYTVSPKLLRGDNFIGKLTRNVGEDVGNYTITQGDLSAGNNYQINFVTGKVFEITKATITGITFDDETFEFDGNPKSLKIKGNIPDDVTVTYTNNEQIQIGSHTVTAHLSGVNYEDLDLTSTLTINRRNVLVSGEINKA